LGGIPVNRSAPQGLLPELVRRLNTRERFLLALAPEGTRSKVTRWKSGFHAIARQTRVPIVPVALDYGLREVRFGSAVGADGGFRCRPGRTPQILSRRHAAPPGKFLNRKDSRMIAATEVQTFLDREGLTVLRAAAPTKDSVSAATAVGCTVAEIAKSILLLVGNRPVLVVAAGDVRVKGGLLKQATGWSGQVRLPAPDEVVRYTGYPPGAVSPFLLPQGLPVLLDESLRRSPVIYPAAGDDRSSVGIAFDHLQRLSGGRVVEVCEGRE
jgi:prolyl-tRNA editing enzyme YbaK/EbsC (Cys-tRNA(Pro) deacylase)